MHRGVLQLVFVGLLVASLGSSRAQAMDAALLTAKPTVTTVANDSQKVTLEAAIHEALANNPELATHLQNLAREREA